MLSGFSGGGLSSSIAAAQAIEELVALWSRLATLKAPLRVPLRDPLLGY